MGIREDFAAALTVALPETIKIIDHPTAIDRIDASTRAVIMLTRESFEPGPGAGSYFDDFELVVIEPRIDQEGTAETALEEITHEVRDILDALTWLTWSKATRAVFADQYPAYQFAVRIITTKE